MRDLRTAAIAVVAPVQAAFVRLPLHRRIAVFVSSILVAVFFAFTYVSWEALTRSIESRLAERGAVAAVIASHLDDFLSHGQGHLAVAAAAVSRESPDDTRAQQAALDATSPQLAFYYAHIWIVDPSGSAIVVTPAGSGEPPAATRGLVAGNGPRISDVVRLSDGRPGILFTYPLIGDGRHRWLAADLVLPHQSISGMLRDLMTERSGHVEIVDGAGRVVSATLDEPVGGPSEHLAFILPLLRTRQATVGTAPAEPGSDAHVTAFAPLDASGWGVALGQEQAEAFAAVRDLRDRMVGVAAVALAAALGLAWLGTLSVVGPIRALTRAGERMATGDLSTPIRIGQPDEIGRLGAVLEATRERLSESIAATGALNRELEQRVRDRTAELEVTNRHLATLLRVASAASRGDPPGTVLTVALRELAASVGCRRAAAYLVMEDGSTTLATAVGEAPVPECDEACTTIRAGGRTVGSICLAALDHPLEAEELALSSGVAQQVAFAFENARLSEERARLEAARRMESLRAAFLASASHELRTPLGVIKGYATTLLRDDVRWDAALQREFLASIDEESDRLTEIVNALLESARVSEPSLSLDRSEVDIADVVRRAVERSGVQRDVRVRGRAAPAAYVDAPRIEQVLTNLLQNAAKYSSMETPIEVETGVRDGAVEIAVLDRGIGIRAEDRERVFEPFFRGGDARVERMEGSGLGLAISRAIVQAHGGQIRAEAREGGGTVLRVSLPLAAPATVEAVL